MPKQRAIAATLPAEPESDEFLCIPLIDLKPDSCRYPHGENPITFCGQRARDDSPYCKRHHKMCHTTYTAPVKVPLTFK